MASSDFSLVRHIQMLCVMVHTATQIPPSSVWAAWRAVYLYNGRKRHTHGKCPCRQPPAFLSACFWGIARSPRASPDRHWKPACQAARCHVQNYGICRWTSASLSLTVRPPAVSSWCVPNSFHLFVNGVPNPHSSFGHASLRIYDKLLIILIMTSNMLCKVQDL